MRVVPLTLRAANDFISSFHRHHKATRGHKFSMGLVDEEGTLRGVVVCGRPVSRMLDNGRTLEVTRLATDGYENACSALYGASKRVAREMGYEKIITYILESEPGTSLKASGWKDEGPSGGGDWSVPSRPREYEAPQCIKRRFGCVLRAIS